jgi:polysaccharide biosynthesis transport protein
VSAYFESMRRHRELDAGSTPAMPAPSPIRPARPPVTAVRPPAVAPKRDHIDNSSFDVLREQLAVRGDGRAVQAVVFTACGQTEPCGDFVGAFARNLAALGSRVLVIDGNEATAAGLGDLASVVRSGGPVTTEASGQGRLAVLEMRLTQGEKEPFLRSSGFSDWLGAQRAVFDYVLVAAPPVALFADAMLLGRVTDGVVLVIHAETTERSALTRARGQLDRAGVTVLGAVLDGVRHELPSTLRRYLGDT